MRKQVEVLEHHSRADAELADLLALRAGPVPSTHDPDSRDLDRSLARLLEEVDAAQKRALPRARATEDDDDLPRPDIQIHVLQHLVPAEGLPQVLDPNRSAFVGGLAHGVLVVAAGSR